MISIIVAASQNNAIGKNNQLLWHISQDLKRFKQLTTGKTIIMGRKTFESLPNGALPNRKNIVVTRNPQFNAPNTLSVNSLEQAFQVCNAQEECFVIGGGEIYQQAMLYANKIYLTRIYDNFEADTFFTTIAPEQWQITKQENFEILNTNFLKYSFFLYEKIESFS
jgi:dihydrofolate reductase